MWKRFKRLLRGFRPRHLRYVFRTLSVGPPIAGILIGLLLCLPAQMSEVYLGLFEGGPLLASARALIALFCLGLLCCLLYYWHLFRSSPKIGEIYEEYPDLSSDRNLTLIRDGKAAVCASLPILGLLAGLYWAFALAEKTCANLTGALDRLQWQAELGPDCATSLLGLRLASIKLVVVAALVLSCAFLLLPLIVRKLDPWRSKYRIRWSDQPTLCVIVAVASLLALLAIAGPIIAPPNVTVSIAWWAGPAVAILVVLTSAVTILMALSWLSHRIAVALLVLGVVFAAFGIKGNVSTPTTTTSAASVGAAPAAEGLHKAQLRAHFLEWLKKRRTNGYDRYPVFIFAAEGGGIYAASGIALFLAALQDQCPHFAEHIFAISAVSGGAVGATTFHALLDQPTSSGCRPIDQKALGKTTSNLDRVLRADHLSPIGLFVLPDIVGKVLPLPRDRAAALEWSLACAFENRNLARDAFALCPRIFKNKLQAPFDDHWRDGETPALVLNSTWVETGFRVAFAPKGMPLKGIGDGTLYSFSELPSEPIEDLTVVRAAVASARFPLIAPPWTLRHTGTRIWNFVDGGYADNSGSTTALEIYKTLEETARISKADLYLIILTDAVGAPDPTKINGSGFSDTMGPISALLNVRSQLASRAVTQAIDHFKLGDPTRELVARAGNSKLLVARLDQRSVPLTLGWKISRSEIDLVRLMLGNPHQCRNEPPRSKGVTEAEKDIDATTATIVDNSCIKRRIVDLLSTGKPRSN